MSNTSTKYVRRGWFFFGLGDIFVPNLVRKRHLRQNCTKKEITKYFRGKKKLILGKKRPVPCYNFVLGTKEAEKNIPRTQKRNLDTKMPRKENFLGGNGKTKGVVADPPLLCSGDVS